MTDNIPEVIKLSIGGSKNLNLPWVARWVCGKVVRKGGGKHRVCRDRVEDDLGPGVGYYDLQRVIDEWFPFVPVIRPKSIDGSLTGDLHSV